MWHLFSAIPFIPSLLSILLLKFKFKNSHPFENLGKDVSVDMVIAISIYFQFSRYIDNFEKKDGLMMNQHTTQVKSNFKLKIIFAIYYFENCLLSLSFYLSFNS